MQDYFHKNIKELIRVNPYLGSKLFAMQGIENFEIFLDENDAANINIVDKRDFTPLYKTKPIDETVETLNRFKPYSRYPYLYFYGIGNGIFFKVLLENQDHKRVIVIEPEIEILFIALHFNDYSAEIQSHRLVLLSTEEVTFTQMQNYFQHEEKIYLKTYHLDAISEYYFNKKSDKSIIETNKIIVEALNHCVLGLGNDLTDALQGIEQHVSNVENMVKTPTTVELVKNAKNTELAIIVSTGPSLAKQLPLLKEIKNHVTIISVDASLPILAKHDIKPDIVVSMERIANTAKFFVNTPKEFQKDIIFALTSIQDKVVFESIKDGQIQISMRPFGYTKYFDLNNWGYIGIGMSAANFAYEIAYQSKFKRVVLIGQDLAYGDDGTSHSDGHTFGKNERDYRYDDKMVTAYGGKGEVRASLVWALFKNFFEVDIANTKDVLETINATEGGARIEGSIEMPFKEVIEKYVDFEHKKEQIVLKEPSSEDIEKNIIKVRDKIGSMLAFASKVYTEVTSLFEEISEEIKIFNEIDAKENYDRVNYNKVLELIQKLDVIKEYFLDREFTQVFNDSTQAFIFHQEVNLATIQVRDSNTDKEKKLKMIDWIYAHQYWLFSLAGSMKATIDIILYGIDENNSEDFLKDMITKYSDTKEYDEFIKNKFYFTLKKKLSDNTDFRDTPFFVRFNYLVNILESKYGKDYIYNYIKEFMSDNDQFLYHVTLTEKVMIRNALLAHLNKLQAKMIQETFSEDKKNVLIFIQDKFEKNNPNATISSFMRKEYESIKSSINEDKYNITVAVSRPFVSNDLSYLGSYSETRHLNISLDDSLFGFEEKYTPYMLGADLIIQSDYFDHIISLEANNDQLFEMVWNWRRTGTYYARMDMIYPDNTDITLINPDNFSSLLSSKFN